MKKLLIAAMAASVLTAPAMAQQTNHYASSVGPLPLLGSTANNPASGFLGLPRSAWDAAVANNLATRYTVNVDSTGDTVQADDNVDVVFTLTGRVNKDCSFYAGNTAGARTIDFGTIGIRTGDNENDDTAFEMAGPLEADVDTVTAGCNFNSVVEISKNDIRGLVNNASTGFDTNEFQNYIPYTVRAQWTGVALNAQVPGTTQTLTVGDNQNAGSRQQGAFRSRMEIDFDAQVQDLGLVAGTYTGTTTLVLRAL